MKIGHKWAVVVATALGVAGYGVATRTSFARGGGGGHGGGGHGGGHHEGEHHAAHHEGEHHPYHPSEHHMAGHDHHDDHHDDHHWNHHHHDWHYAGWGANPGFWGGLGLGYAAGWGWNGGWGGGTTYLGNPSNTTTDTADNAANTAASVADDNSGDDNTEQAANGPEQFPVDVWPELGISTYSGEYGQSKGLVIVRVMPHSVADKAGLVPGDVILSYNGKPTPDDETMETILDSAKGDFSLSVWDARTGRKSVITGALEAPSNAQPEKTSG